MFLLRVEGEIVRVARESSILWCCGVGERVALLCGREVGGRDVERWRVIWCTAETYCSSQAV